MHSNQIPFANDLTQSLWSTETGDFNSLAPTETDATVVDTNAIEITISDDLVNAIFWLASGSRGLMIGTDSGEFVMTHRLTMPVKLESGNVEEIVYKDKSKGC